MRPIRTGAGILALAAFVGAGCSGESDAPKAPLAFCRPAANYDHALSTKRRDLPVARQIRYLRAMAAAAPREILADTRVFLRALERLQGDADDTRVVDNPKVKAAVEHVNRYAAQGCDFYARQSGGI